MSARHFRRDGANAGLPECLRELLEFGGLLHNIGRAIDHQRDNRHSYYLIKNAELFGFDADEIEVIAQAARGYRNEAANSMRRI